MALAALWARMLAACLAAIVAAPAIAQTPFRFAVEQFADLSPGPQSSGPRSLMAHGGMLYFNAKSGAGYGLFRTDGTSIHRIADNDAFARLAAGNTLYFTDSSRLFVERGDSLAELGAGEFNLSTAAFPSEFVEFQDQLYFTADNKLFRSDGVSVEPVSGAMDLQSARFLTPFGNRLAFSAIGPQGREAYITNGTTVELLSDINPSVGDSAPGEFTALGDDLYFSANGPGGFELYRYDGIAVDRVADINSGSGHSSPNHLTPLGGSLIFAATGPQGRELYKTDGVTTNLLADIWPGPGDSDLMDVFNHQFADFGNELVFVARGPDGYGPYRTDGDTVSPLPLSNGEPMRGLSSSFTVAGDRLLFLSERRLHQYNGESVGPLSNLHVRQIALIRGELVLNAEGPDGIELYTIHGDDVVQLANVYPGEGHLGDGVFGPFSSNPGNFVEFNGDLYFTARGPAGEELYRLTVVPEPMSPVLAALAGAAAIASRARSREAG